MKRKYNFCYIRVPFFLKIYIKHYHYCNVLTLGNSSMDRFGSPWGTKDTIERNTGSKVFAISIEQIQFANLKTEDDSVVSNCHIGRPSLTF